MRKHFATEIGLLGVWDIGGMSLIKSAEDYQNYLTDDRRIAELMNSGYGVFWNTGGDGNFVIDVRINPEASLQPEEVELVQMRSEGHKLLVTSDVLIGSPEGIIDFQKDLQQGYISALNDLENGLYKVDLFFVFDYLALEGAKEGKDDITAHVVSISSVPDNFGFKSIWQVPEFG